MSRHEQMLREREQRALDEVGRTAVHPLTARALAVFFLVTVFAVPVAQHFADWRAHVLQERSDPVPQAYDIFRRAAEVPARFQAATGGLWQRVRTVNASFLRDLQEYEEALEERSVFVRAVLPPTQSFLTGVLGLGNEQAYPGRGQWLFYRPDFDYLTGPGFLDEAVLGKRSAAVGLDGDAAYPDPRPAILEFRDQLARRGIGLVLLPTPVKTTAHPERFAGPGPWETPLQNASYARLVGELETRGVRVFDLLPVLAAMRSEGHTNLYLATDTHWRPEVVVRVARALADFLVETDTLPAPRGVKTRVESVSVTNLGDVAAMLRLPEGQRIYQAEPVVLRQILTGSGEFWRPSKSADVLVLGDSFSNIYSQPALNWGESAGLVEQLSHELGRPVDALLRNDNGSFATRQMLGEELARGRDRLAGKRVVVWQFAARELASGQWKPIPLDLREPAGSETLLALEAGERMTLTGLISDMSAVPKPGSVPYRDHVLALHWVDLRRLDGTPARSSEAVVYTFSMRDNQWTEAARWRPGQRVTMELVPWREVEGELGRMNRGELDGDRLLFAEPGWGKPVIGGRR